MLVRYHPSSLLTAAVDCIWLSRRRDDSPDFEHMLPSGNTNLIFALHDAPISWASGKSGITWRSWTHSIVHGPQTSYYLAGPKPKGTVVGVSFRPGMAGPILGVPLSELQDAHIPLDELWGYRASGLHDRLASANDPLAMLRLLESELIARIRRPLLLHPAVAYALGSNLSGYNPSQINHIRKQTGYSARHFIELFRSAVGLTPKRYYRIRRFSSVLAHLAARDSSLADVAVSAGYADQAHLSREFRELAGITPSSYRPRSADSAHHHVATHDKVKKVQDF